MVGAICGCGDLTLPSQARPAFVLILGGDRQTGEVGTTLPDSLTVRVTDLTGRPVQGVVVRFAPISDGVDPRLVADTARTDADGQARSAWVLGQRAGPARLEALVPDGGQAALALFSATALPGPAEMVRSVWGDGQTGTAGSLLHDSLVVLVTDRFNNPISGAGIDWHTADGGTVSIGASATGVDGRASAAWWLGGRAGPQTAQAMVPGLSGSPVTFGAMAQPGPPVAVLAVYGDGQSAPVGTQLTDSIVARLVDGLGNGVPGRSISWVITAGGGGLLPTVGTTDANGRAFTRWTLGPGAGVQTALAVVSGFEPAAFTATAVSQSPATLAAASPTTLVGQAGQPVSPPPSVRVTDAGGNPVPGVTVTFSVKGSGGQLANRTGAGTVVTVATDGSGTAAVTSWTLGTAVGTDSVEARASGPAGPLAGSPVLFAAVVLPAPAAQLRFLAQPTTVTAGQPMAPSVTVGVQDQNGNLVTTYSGTVTLALGSSPPGGTLGGTTTAGVTGGIATFGGLILTRAGAGYALVANALPLIAPATSESFSVTAAPAARLALVVQPADTATSGEKFIRQPTVRLEDAFGNPVNQLAVPVTASIEIGGGTLGGTVTMATLATGVASYTDLSLTGLPGLRTLRFSAPGLLPVSSKPIILIAAPTATLTLAAGGNQTAPVGTVVAVPPAVKVTDLTGTPVAGVPVAFTVTGGGGSITVPSAITDLQGIASVGSWRLGAIKGTNTLTATAAGVAGSPLGITAVGRFAYVSARAGNEFSCGISTAGTPYCWGRNNRGQLGNGGTADQTTPAPVAGGLIFQGIGLGAEHACALSATGAAYCWGFNANGQLGDGTTSNRPAPVPVTGGIAFVSIQGGDAHTCGITPAGAAYCWGQNNKGQLGDGTSTARSAPVPVTGGLAFSALAMGIQFSCGLTTGGAVYCWGLNKDGQIGDGTKANRPTPQLVIASGATEIAAGDEFACALAAGGLVSCWGKNDRGQLGNGTKTDHNTPAPVSGGTAFSSLTAGGKHTCALTGTGAAYCWGLNADGELGDATPTDRLVPTPVQGTTLFATLSAGGLHTLAITPSGVGYGWGRDANGQVGAGTTAAKLTPVAIVEP